MFEQMDLVHWVVLVLMILLSVSEALPWTDKVKASSIFQLVINGAKAIKDVLSKK